MKVYAIIKEGNIYPLVGTNKSTELSQVHINKGYELLDLEVDEANNFYAFYKVVPIDGIYPKDEVAINNKTEQDLQKSYTDALEALMDKQAQTKGYDNRYTASARAGVVGSPFQAEGQTFAVWMDTCYSLGYTILADVKAGTSELPTEEEFLASMPPLVW